MPAPSSSPRSVRLRVYRPRDHPAVLRLWRSTGLRTGPSDEPAEIERSRRRDPDLFLVAERGGRLVGAVLGRFDGRRGWVNHLAVDPGLRGQGLGRQLMDELERRLARKGCLKVNLHVEVSNRRVEGFYRRIGYARRPLLFMEKWLARGPNAARPRRQGLRTAPRSPSRER